MWKRAISLGFLLVLIGCAAQSDAPGVHSAAIEPGGVNPYKAARLTPAVYNAANRDLSDLLIRDGNGDNVPYFIYSGTKSASSGRETHQMALINSYLKDDSFYFDYKVAALPGGDVVSTSLEFTTKHTNFVKEVDVYGSYDNIHWDYVQKDTLYSIDDMAKRAIVFARPQKYTHFRLKFANNLEQITFDAVTLVYSVETDEETYFIESLEPAFTVESGDKVTNIILEGLRNLRLCDVTIYTDSTFKRSVRASTGPGKELYNLSLNGAAYADTTLPLNWSVSQEDTFRLTIADGDDRPISVTGVTVRYYADDVVFAGAPDGGCTLVFGKGAAKTAPVYDIARYKEDILRGEIDRVALGEIRYAAETTAPQRDFRLVFNLVMVAVTLLLGAVIVLRLRKR